MSKQVGVTDSGGSEAAAVLGEDLESSLSFLETRIRIPMPAAFEELRGTDPSWIVAACLTLGCVACLGYAWEHGDLGLAASILSLLGAGVMALGYTRRPPPDPDVVIETGPVFRSGRCQVCREPFLYEVGIFRSKGGSLEPSLVSDARVCSTRCASAGRAARSPSGVAPRVGR